MVSQIIESMEKKKRVITRKGDVFCVEIDSQYKVYLQYVAVDMTMLNSTVIRVFKTKYSIDSDEDIETIVNDDIWFYAHTMLQVGLKGNYWYKCGKSKNIGNPESIMFRIPEEGDLSIITVSHNWDIWKINKEMQWVGNLTEDLKKIDLGDVFSPIFIYEKIKYGEYQIKEIL